VTVPLGGDAEQNVTLHPAGVTQDVTVTGAPPLADAAVQTNLEQGEIDALATSRTLAGIAALAPGLTDRTPNSSQVSIHGARGSETQFMVNGVDINDNLFGSPQDLFIEDAIEETQVITSGVPAEYGRFSGGVVNAITRSGGNTFSGSLRVNLTNDAWTTETPFEEERDIEHESQLTDSYEGTFGGPVLRDRIWFFLAGRLLDRSTTETFDVTGLPYTIRNENRRGEVKITVSPAASHTLIGGYLNNDSTVVQPSFPDSIDPATLDELTTPNWYAFGTYRGVLGNRLLAEARFADRRYTFQDAGGTSTALEASPFFALTQPGHYNAPYFDATDPEERNNRQVTGNATYFAEGAGRHEVKVGYEWFRTQNTGGNSQSSTNFVFDADYLTGANGDPVFDGDGRMIPVFAPFDPGNPFAATSLIENWIAVRGAVLNVDHHSFFLQNRWTINRHVSANLGLRWEHVRSEATGGNVGVDTSTVVPRLALSYDVRGDGQVVLSTTYGHYSGRYNETQVAETSNVGNPDKTLGFYFGPPGQGIDFAPGFDPANYQIVEGEFPTLNVFFEDGLSSSVTRELTASAGVSAGARAYLEGIYVWRDTGDFIEDFVELSNGTTDVVRDGIELGEFTNVVYRNSDLPERRYQAAVLQGRYRVRDNWTAHGSWTIQLQNEGNVVGEALAAPAIASVLGDYPEGFSAERHFPTGRLPNFQRHRVRAWTIYTVGMGTLGDVSLSGLWRVESGAPYSLAATRLPLTPTQDALLAGYPDAPASQNIFFGERGSETFPGFGLLDVSVNYAVPVFRSLGPWVKLDLFNILDNDKLISFDTRVVPDPDSPLDELGLPTGFIRGPNFGEATGPGNFPRSLGMAGGRTVRVAVGVRF
jgi:hypothetical protein